MGYVLLNLTSEVSNPVWQIKYRKIIRQSKNLKVIKPHKIKGLAPLIGYAHFIQAQTILNLPILLKISHTS